MTTSRMQATPRRRLLNHLRARLERLLLSVKRFSDKKHRSKTQELEQLTAARAKVKTALGRILADWGGRLAEICRMLGRVFVPYLTQKPWIFFFSTGLKSRNITTIPLDLNLADPVLAHEFYHGRRIVRAGCASPWAIEPPSYAWEESLHDFGWLRHMKAAKTTLAGAYARILVDEWITMATRQPNHTAWESHVAARRIISWLSHADMLLSGASAGFQRKFLKSLSLNLRYLRGAYFFMGKTQIGQLDIAMALCFAALVLETSPAQLRAAQHRLERAFDAEILTDGGHISRNPAALVPMLADLISLCHLYQKTGRPVPEAFIAMRERIDQALRFFLHRDQSLANFNGVGPLLPERLNGLLNVHAPTISAPAQMPYSGYQRLSHGATTVLVDTGCQPAGHQADMLAKAHAGCLSFEMSSSAHRFIVNCGIDPNGRDEWHSLGRLTAAHSTATLNDTSSARFHCDRRGRMLLRGGLGPVRVKPIERPDCTGFVACHNGYGRAFNLLHQRSMALSRDGNLLQGSDRFVQISPERSPKTVQWFSDKKRRSKTQELERSMESIVATVRFHLHPDVEVSRLDSRALRLEVMRADVWIMTCHAEMYLEDSIYFCGLQGPVKTRQIVFSFSPGETREVYWAFQREVRKQSSMPVFRPPLR